MKSLFRIVVLFAFSVSLAACGGATPADSPEIAIVVAVEAAWNAEDLDTVMSYYADNAVVVNPLGTFTGKQEIRSLFESAIDEFTMNCGNHKVSGNIVSYECALAGRNDGKVFVGETYDLVIKNGLIVSDKYTGTFEP
jgi:hypothetical protein